MLLVPVTPLSPVLIALVVPIGILLSVYGVEGLSALLHGRSRSKGHR